MKNNQITKTPKQNKKTPTNPKPKKQNSKQYNLIWGCSMTGFVFLTLVGSQVSLFSTDVCSSVHFFISCPDYNPKHQFLMLFIETPNIAGWSIIDLIKQQLLYTVSHAPATSPRKLAEDPVYLDINKKNHCFSNFCFLLGIPFKILF